MRKPTEEELARDAVRRLQGVKLARGQTWEHRPTMVRYDVYRLDGGRWGALGQAEEARWEFHCRSEPVVLKMTAAELEEEGCWELVGGNLEDIELAHHLKTARGQQVTYICEYCGSGIAVTGGVLHCGCRGPKSV